MGSEKTVRVMRWVLIAAAALVLLWVAGSVMSYFEDAAVSAPAGGWRLGPAGV